VALDGHPEWLAFAAAGYYAAEPNMGRFTVPYRFHDAFAYGSAVLIVAAGWLVRYEIARRGPGTTRLVPVMAGPAVTAPVLAGSAVTVAGLPGSVVTADTAERAELAVPVGATTPANGRPLAAPSSDEDQFDAFAPRSASVRRRPGVRV
jgi:hypothetical protein